ncbi:DUF2726 domain-containing protein [Mannheimia haemolytica]|uniref:DUF2726 domain-containing protein n=1 Tax=Mannheimia haemolytica TaxID=75985 RepID=UPI0039FC3A98
MYKGEYRLFKRLSELLTIQHHNQGFKLFTQVGIGGFIQPNEKYKNSGNFDEVYRIIGGYRVDFLIIDCYGKPVIVIEYQGSGHFQGSFKENDEVKRILFSKCQIRLFEIFSEETSWRTHTSEISKVLNWHYQSIKQKQEKYNVST